MPTKLIYVYERYNGELYEPFFSFLPPDSDKEGFEPWKCQGTITLDDYKPHNPQGQQGGLGYGNNDRPSKP